MDIKPHSLESNSTHRLPRGPNPQDRQEASTQVLSQGHPGRGKTAGETPLLGTCAVGAKLVTIKGRDLAWENRIG